MKLRFLSIAVIIGLLFLFSGAAICQEKISASEWTEKIGQGTVNWSAGYIEAIGIGAPPERLIGKANARPMALRAAKLDAYRNLLEITKGVRVDSSTTVKDFVVESDIINTQVDGLVKGGVVVDQRYVSDGSVEVRVRVPLYEKLAQVMIPASIEKRRIIPPPEKPAVSTPPEKPVIPVVSAPPEKPVVPAPSASVPQMAYTGLVVDARGIAARPAMSPRIYDQDGNEVYGSANVDREYAVQQGMSGYARDLTAAQSNQRVTSSPFTVKALKTSGVGKADLIIGNADAQKIRASAENASFMKKCRVMIVLD